VADPVTFFEVKLAGLDPFRLPEVQGGNSGEAKVKTKSPDRQSVYPDSKVLFGAGDEIRTRDSLLGSYSFEDSGQIFRDLDSICGHQTVLDAVFSTCLRKT
jgi:hypothetical protein